MPEDIIDRVHALAWQQKAAPGLLFLDCNQARGDNAFDDEDSDSDNSNFEPGDEGVDSDIDVDHEDDDAMDDK